MNFPNDLMYTKSHEWIKMQEDGTALVGLYSPLSGVVDAFNDILLYTPEAINEAPYDAWFIKVSDITDKEELMDAGAYEAFLKTIEE